MNEENSKTSYSGLNVQEINLEQEMIDLESVTKVPEFLARKHKMIAFEKFDNKLKVAMLDPFNIYALDDLRLSTNMEIIPVRASEKNIQYMIEQFYSFIQTKNIVNQFEKEIRDETVAHMEYKIEDKEVSASMKLIHNLLERCVLNEASDMHIEPFEKGARIRYR